MLSLDEEKAELYEGNLWASAAPMEEELSWPRWTRWAWGCSRASVPDMMGERRGVPG